MSASEQSQTETQFSCTLCWGKDPAIRLEGVVTQLSGEEATVLLTNVDRQLVPDVGRKISLEINWMSSAGPARKQLVCRGTVGRIISDDSMTRVICGLRTNRFRDLRVAGTKTPDRSAQTGSDWKM